MTRDPRLLSALLIAALVVGACGSDGDSGVDEADGGLRDAEDARSEELVEGTTGAFGEVIELDGTTVLVSGAVVSGDDGGPWLAAEVRIENPSETNIQFVDVGIVCAGNDETGGWQAGSTLDLNAGIPAGTFDEGTVNLLLPGDGRFGEPIPDCATPAALRITPVPDPMTGTEVPAVVQLPDELVARLNAAG
jgi:hypothetical protein